MWILFIVPTLVLGQIRDGSINFVIKRYKCDDGIGTLILLCSVDYPNIIKFFKNGFEVSQCTTFPVPPYQHCEDSDQQDGIIHSNLNNVSMIYTVQTVNTDILHGKWICQNGGTHDPSLSMLVPRITCEPNSNSYNGKQLDVLMSLSLILVPFFAFCLTTICRRQGPKGNGEPTCKGDKDDNEKNKADNIQFGNNCVGDNNITDAMDGIDNDKGENNEYGHICVDGNSGIDDMDGNNKNNGENNLDGSTQNQQSEHNCCKKMIEKGCTDSLTTKLTIYEEKEICAYFIMVFLYIVIVIYIAVTKIGNDLATGIIVIIILAGTLAFSFFSVIIISRKQKTHNEEDKRNTAHKVEGEKRHNEKEKRNITDIVETEKTHNEKEKGNISDIVEKEKTHNEKDKGNITDRGEEVVDETMKREENPLLKEQTSVEIKNTVSKKGLQITLCSIMLIMYSVIATYISLKNIEKDLKNCLSVVCLLTGTLVFSFVSVIWTSDKAEDKKTKDSHKDLTDMQMPEFPDKH